ncbi:MAG: hypothetical protein SWQ30_20630 [Thermodesulfobacteriota bacterium]|nr:hypothetical protein [Thermodesulfobacteriota bacterium]
MNCPWTQTKYSPSKNDRSVTFTTEPKMPDFDSSLKGLFLDKPECVINLPVRLLSSGRIKEYRAMSRLAIVEIAGRDSVAAAISSVEREGFTDLLPTYAYTATEFGPWTSVTAAVQRLARRLPAVRVHDLLVLGSPGFWQALNGRFMAELISRFGFYAPCIGCHLYLHCIRIPLAVTLGKVPIISGERELHDKAIKVNQISEALDVYQEIAEDFGVHLLLPLRRMAEGRWIEQILGFQWQAGKEQLGCVLSGNYRSRSGDPTITAPQVERFLEEFAGPCARRIVEAYIAGRVPNHLEIAAQVLEN